MWGRAAPAPFVPDLPGKSRANVLDGDGQRPTKEWCQCPRLKMVQDVGMWCPDCFTVREDKLQIDTREPVFSEDRGAGPPPAKRCYIRQGGKRQQKQAELLQQSRNRQSDPGAGPAPRRGARDDTGTGTGTSKERRRKQTKPRAEPGERKKRDRPPKEPKKRPEREKKTSVRGSKRDRPVQMELATATTTPAETEAATEGAPFALALALTDAAQSRPKRKRPDGEAEVTRPKRQRKDRPSRSRSQPAPREVPDPQADADLDRGDAADGAAHSHQATTDEGAPTGCPVHGSAQACCWMVSTLDGLVAKKDRVRGRLRRRKGPCTCTQPAAGAALPPCIADASSNLSQEALADAEVTFTLARGHAALQGASNKRLRGVFLASLYGAATRARCGFDLTAARRAMGISSHAFNEACLLLKELRATDDEPRTTTVTTTDQEQGQDQPTQASPTGDDAHKHTDCDESLGAFVRKAVQKLREDTTANAAALSRLDTDKIERFAQFARRSCADLNSAHARSVCAAALWVFFGPKVISERAICSATMVSADTLKRYAKLLSSATPGTVRIAAAISVH